MELHKKKCAACEGEDVKSLGKSEVEKYIKEVTDWELNSASTKITKRFFFKDFVGSMEFVNKVARIAEEEGHHPNIDIVYDKVKLELTTHAISGLTENDFIVAAKIDALTLY